MEQWKDIEGYAGYYRVSTCGKVLGVKRNRPIAILVNLRGYFQVMLSMEGMVKPKVLHRLIAIAFIPNPDNKAQVNHKDGNKLNNDISNLEWCSQSDNVRHMHAMKAAGTHVKQGFKYRDDATGLRPSGYIKKENPRKRGTKLGFKLSKIRAGRKVMNVKTGMVYSSAAEVADNIGFARRAFQKRLSGELKNTTEYVYL